MTRQEYKAKAKELIGSTRPPVMLVTFALVAVGWLMSLIERRLGASPLYIDLGAAQAMDAENLFVLDWSNVTFFSSLLVLAFQLMTTLLNFGYVRYCLNVHRKQPAGFSDLFSGFEYPGKVLLLWLLEGLLLCLLSLLLIVPAVIGGYAWSMSRQLLADHPDWSPVRCMRESRLMMQGHKWELFKLHLSFFGWFFLMGLIPAVAVFVDPYLGLSECGFYRDLTGDAALMSPETQTNDSLPPPEQ